MKFADYQQIQFNHDKAYWSKLKTPFKLEFYHQGMYFDTPVKINEVTSTSVKQIKYSPDYFNFGSVKHDPESVKNPRLCRLQGDLPDQQRRQKR